MDAGILRSVRHVDGSAPPSRLLRAARSGLGLGLLDVARSAGLSVSKVHRLEEGDVDASASAKLRQTLEAAGAEFIDVDGALTLRFGIGSGGSGPSQRNLLDPARKASTALRAPASPTLRITALVDWSFELSEGFQSD